MTEAEDAPVYGRRPVLEMLRARGRQAEEIAILAQGRGPALDQLLTLARGQGVKISFRTREQLTALCGTSEHQGVVARVASAGYVTLEEILAVPAERGEPAFFLALDRVQDPRNLGAILRTGEATGVHGVVVPKHHAAGLTGATAKSSTGALEWVRVAREANLVNSLTVMKSGGIWVVGAVPSGGRAPWDVDLTSPVCLVLGGEGEGLRPLVAKTCDLLVTLPMRGQLQSVNVGAAAAVLCYEVLRQRRAQPGK